MMKILTQYDEAAIRGCYLNGCSVDEIYSVFEGDYSKTEIMIIVDDLVKKTGWRGKDWQSRKQTFNYSLV